MKVEGGCYCGALRYEVEGNAVFTGQCHCRECQYISGGGPNVFAGVPEAGIKYVQGAPKLFKRTDLKAPVTREFCAECGTHLITRTPTTPGVVILKIGTLDEPAALGEPKMAIFMVDKQPFHHLPAGMAAFERMPG